MAMGKLTIHNLGPIQDAEIACRPFMVFTGEHGKSTITKAIYYFKTVKDVIFNLITDPSLQKRMFNLNDQLITSLKQKFIQTFGSPLAMEPDMAVSYQYSQETYLKVSLKSDASADLIQIECSQNISDFLKSDAARIPASETEVSDIPDIDLKILEDALADLFSDYETAVYIPAGRSLMALLSGQCPDRKSLPDGCTQIYQDYLQRILNLKPQFKNGLSGILENKELSVQDERYNQIALDLIHQILEAEYIYSGGQEQIVFDTKCGKKSVTISFASAAQQEALWILNLLFHYMNQEQKAQFIIEEPESHLFPTAQKAITELIALASNRGNSVIITTHSPYVLGSLNNLVYAGSLPEKFFDKLNQVIDHHKWIREQDFAPYFVKNGLAEDISDPEMHGLKNEKADEISNVINDDFDRILDVENPWGQTD